ncbi:CBN-RIL-2 protein [Caenorhabditis brenneri]|uniref:CBN-RIL-2 protein n=1 Tax=Caenorhabditis brenneri TaxID=135651 RepID=G0P556_CAEBE|nr:CBN-RIL-2 protein [Caenorhabditis brenneri]
MWRFAVYTPKTTILNKACFKSVTQALKHTDGRMDYFRLFSFDDFGLLSNNRSHSVESMSSAGGEQNFLEQLLRNDTLTTFSNIQIPTTMSSRELGSANDIFGYDYVSELLSEGAIPEELAEDLAMEPSISEIELLPSDSATYHDDQEPSTSGIEVTAFPFKVPNLDKQPVKEDTRTFITEKPRRDRKLNLSTTAPLQTPDTAEQLFHVPETVSIQNIGEMLFPDSLPQDSYTSSWKDDKPPSGSIQAVPTLPTVTENLNEFSLDVLEGIMALGSIEELRQDLKAVGFWPEWIFSGDKTITARTNKILRFVVENAADYKDAEEIIKTFAASHMRAAVPDDVILRLTIKSTTPYSNITDIIAQLDSVAKMSLSRQLRPNRSLVEACLVDLFKLAIQKCPKTSSSLLAACCKLNFDRSSVIFMKCFGEIHALNDNFLNSFEEWKKLSVKYGRQDGIDSYWMAALSSEGPMEKRIEALLSHSGKCEHPFTTMAQMICAFIKLDKLDEALEIFQAVSVSGKYFKKPLASFVANNDLKCIERLATLVERGMIAERRRGGGNKTANKSEEKREKTRQLSEGVHTVLAKFCGAGGQKKTKFVNKNSKKKIHRVDEGQLHDLCEALQKGWMQCADSKESVERLVAWCHANRLEIDEKKIKSLENKVAV